MLAALSVLWQLLTAAGNFAGSAGSSEITRADLG
jgi:hypothetical protein